MKRFEFKHFLTEVLLFPDRKEKVCGECGLTAEEAALTSLRTKKYIVGSFGII